jgi:hypothetical protein
VVDVGVDGHLPTEKGKTVFATVGDGKKKCSTIYSQLMNKPSGTKTYYPAFLKTRFDGFKMIPSKTSGYKFTKVIGYFDSKNRLYKRQDSNGNRHGEDFNFKSLHFNLNGSSPSLKLKVNSY